MLERLRASTLGQTQKAYGEGHTSNYAKGMALSALIATFPLVLFTLAAASYLVRDPQLQGKFYDTIASVFPSNAHDQVIAALEAVRSRAPTVGALSGLGLLWSGTGVFASMEFALTAIFGGKQRHLARRRLMGLLMMVGLLAAVVASVTINSAAALSPTVGIRLLGSVVSAAALLGVLVAIYRWVPNKTFPTKDVLPGALIAAALVELFSLVFPLTARFGQGFSRYGQQFILFFVVTSWLTVICRCILFGAVFNRVRLGAPTEDGVAAEPASPKEEPKRPVDAAKEQRKKAASR